MHLHDIHIVVGRDAKGKLKELYLGDDAVKANGAYEAAAGLEVVGISSFPAFVRMRHPLEETERATVSANKAETDAAAESDLIKIQAAAKRAAAAKLLSEAETLSPTPAADDEPDKKPKTKTK